MTDATVPEHKLGGAALLALSVLLIAPSALACFASFAITHQWEFPASALWLAYEISWYVAVAGVVIVALLAVYAALGRQISRVFVWLTGIIALAGIVLEWYASHIYRTPW